MMRQMTMTMTINDDDDIPPSRAFNSLLKQNAYLLDSRVVPT